MYRVSQVQRWGGKGTGHKVVAVPTKSRSLDGEVGYFARATNGTYAACAVRRLAGVNPGMIPPQIYGQVDQVYFHQYNVFQGSEPACECCCVLSPLLLLIISRVFRDFGTVSCKRCKAVQTTIPYLETPSTSDLGRWATCGIIGDQCKKRCCVSKYHTIAFQKLLLGLPGSLSLTWSPICRRIFGILLRQSRQGHDCEDMLLPACLHMKQDHPS